LGNLETRIVNLRDPEFAECRLSHSKSQPLRAQPDVAVIGRG
jgi:hypothetical protein